MVVDGLSGDAVENQFIAVLSLTTIIRFASSRSAASFLRQLGQHAAARYLVNRAASSDRPI
jgi:hypothetical protein